MAEEFDLPEPEIIDNISFEDKFQELKEDFQSRSPEYTTFQDSDVVMIVLQAVAAIIVDMLFKINAAVKSSLVLLASGAFLDHLAIFHGVERKVLVAADPTAIPAVEEVLEDDETFRCRILTEIKGNTKGATPEYYTARALEADANVASVSVFKSLINTQFVDVAIKTKDNNGVPSAAFLTTIEEYMNRDDIRSISDVVRVQSAVGVSLDVEANITLLPDASATAIGDIQTLFEQRLNATNELGRDITLSWIVSELNTSDVYKVELISPTADAVVDDFEFVALNTITLNEEPNREF